MRIWWVRPCLGRNRMSAKFVNRSSTTQSVCATLPLDATSTLQGPCAPEELGTCSSISVEDIGDTRVTVFRQDEGDAQISTILLRGGTKNGLDDLQRSIGQPTLSLPPSVNMLRG